MKPSIANGQPPWPNAKVKPESYMNPDELELSIRAAFAKGQIMEALGDLATVDRVEVRRAERALRFAIAELNGTARASELVII